MEGTFVNSSEQKIGGISKTTTTRIKTLSSMKVNICVLLWSVQGYSQQDMEVVPLHALLRQHLDSVPTRLGKAKLFQQMPYLCNISCSKQAEGYRSRRVPTSGCQ